ncbi:MAG: hypothetical protein ACJAZF_004730, partial [Granulosicoccus sp.]
FKNSCFFFSISFQRAGGFNRKLKAEQGMLISSWLGPACWIGAHFSDDRKNALGQTLGSQLECQSCCRWA